MGAFSLFQICGCAGLLRRRSSLRAAATLHPRRSAATARGQRQQLEEGRAESLPQGGKACSSRQGWKQSEVSAASEYYGASNADLEEQPATRTRRSKKTGAQPELAYS